MALASRPPKPRAAGPVPLPATKQPAPALLPQVPAPCTTDQLTSLLLAKYPGLAELLPGGACLAVNLEYVPPDAGEPTLLRDGDEVALIPPISGG